MKTIFEEGGGDDSANSINNNNNNNHNSNHNSYNSSTNNSVNGSSKLNHQSDTVSPPPPQQPQPQHQQQPQTQQQQQPPPPKLANVTVVTLRDPAKAKVNFNTPNRKRYDHFLQFWNFIECFPIETLAGI